MQPSDQIAYRVPDAAKVIGLGERKMWDLVRDGQVASYRVGTARLVTRQALLDFVAKQEEAAA